MKYYLKLVMILPVSLFTAIIIYPFLHEFSHSICAIILGASVVDFSLLPLPNVVCNVGLMTNAELFLIAISGTVIPLILCVMIKCKNFWINYVELLITGISIMSFAISIFGFIFAPEILLEQDDIIRFSSLIMGGNVISVFICVTGILVSLVMIYKTLKRCELLDVLKK